MVQQHAQLRTTNSLHSDETRASLLSLALPSSREDQSSDGSYQTAAAVAFVARSMTFFDSQSKVICADDWPAVKSSKSSKDQHAIKKNRREEEGKKETRGCSRRVGCRSAAAGYYYYYYERDKEKGREMGRMEGERKGGCCRKYFPSERKKNQHRKDEILH